MTFELL